MMRLLFVCLLVAASSAAQSRKDITLEDLFVNQTFKIKSVPGFNAMKDGRRYTQLDDEGASQLIRTYNLESGKQGITIFKSTDHRLNGKAIHIDDYSFSDDEKKLLLFTDRQSIYRHSALYTTYYYDLETGDLQPVKDQKIMHASFSPDGSKIAYVMDNNLYYKDLKTGQQTAITDDGEKNKIINGNCDWVYEEEFSFTKAFEWAPDSRHIAWYRFDEERVREYTMTVYDSLYPTPYKYKYPKAGEDNSVITIGLYNLTDGSKVTADIGANTDIYIPRIKWTNNPAQLCIYRLNRHQNHLELLLANANTGKTKKIYDERNKYYIDINDNLKFLPDRTSFIFSSEQTGYTQLFRYDWKTEELTPLSNDGHDIDDLIGIDEKNSIAYYTAAASSPLERKLYAVNFNGRNRRCLTPEAGTHSITTIEGYHYFLDKFSTLAAPPVYYLRNQDGTIIRTLEDNHELVATMNGYDLGNTRFKIFLGANGESLNGWMITPPGFDKTKKYPVLMYQYSGPGSQEVADRFPLGNYFWHQFLAQKGYIIVCVDGTGTGYRGEAFKKKTYLQLGKLESNDQIAVAKHLATLAYVDPERIGIWGWSFGGFMSSNCIFRAPDVFKAAVAVAPVTNWRYYDNIYTERYMRTPAENPEGYDNNAPEKLARNLKGKFLLIHGTGDDNVHFQNSVSLVNELILADKSFDSEYYPNKAHGISGGNTRYHLFTRITDFILKNL